MSGYGCTNYATCGSCNPEYAALQVKRTRGYTGATGGNTYACKTCGATVSNGSLEVHTEWHERTQGD